jgi:hypothetical protein
MKCLKLDMLKTFLSNFDHDLANKPNGQSMYKFTNGLVLNVYETTGAIVFQGEGTGGELADQIKSFIESVNAPFLK